MTANDSQTAAMENEIAHLRGLDLDALRARWRSQTGRAAPSHLPKNLLLRVLAYRAQAAVFGDLDKATVRLLNRIAEDAGSGKRIEVPVPDRVGIRPGTLLVREWEGVSHRVMVMAEGFAWKGSTYPSLSKVARAITGTRWNGPRFLACGTSEVTGERIRDKLAASKRRGIWVGGIVPLGYEVRERKLAVREDEAQIIRLIFEALSGPRFSASPAARA